MVGKEGPQSHPNEYCAFRRYTLSEFNATGNLPSSFSIFWPYLVAEVNRTNRILSRLFRKGPTANSYWRNMFSVEPIMFPFKKISLMVSTPSNTRNIGVSVFISRGRSNFVQYCQLF